MDRNRKTTIPRDTVFFRSRPQCQIARARNARNAHEAVSGARSGAPSFEDPQARTKSTSDRPAPRGFGAIAGHWQPPSKRARWPAPTTRVAITPVGTNLTDSMIGLFTRVQLFEDMGVLDEEGEPLGGMKIPFADEPAGPERLLAMANAVVDEATLTIEPSARIPLFLCLPKAGAFADAPADWPSGLLRSVLAKGNRIAAHAQSFVAKSTGNEVAQSTGGGILSATTQGKAYFQSFSMNVMIENQPAVRHLDLVTNSHMAKMGGNTPPVPWMSTMPRILHSYSWDVHTEPAPSEGLVRFFLDVTPSRGLVLLPREATLEVNLTLTHETRPPKTQTIATNVSYDWLCQAAIWKILFAEVAWAEAATSYQVIGTLSLRLDARKLRYVDAQVERTGSNFAGGSNYTVEERPDGGVPSGR